MSFENAIPLNRVAYGRAAEFDLGAHERGGGGRRSAPEGQARQSVNISEDSMMRMARAKLSRMVSLRLGYDQRGAIASEAVVGSLLSAKA